MPKSKLSLAFSIAAVLALGVAGALVVVHGTHRAAAGGLRPASGRSQVVRPGTVPPTVKVLTNATLGKILVTSSGRTLYHNTKENTGANVCASNAGCRAVWPPLLLKKGQTKPKAGAGLAGTLGTVTRKGLGKQVTYDGWPLYTYAGDRKAGQTNGQGVENIWFALPPAPTVTFTIDVTTTDTTVWGTVNLSYTNHRHPVNDSCNQTTCQLTVPAGKLLHLSETPTDSGTWPFSGWQVDPADGTSHEASPTTITVKSNDPSTITAAYVLATATATATSPVPTATSATPSPTYVYPTPTDCGYYCY